MISAPPCQYWRAMKPDTEVSFKRAMNSLQKGRQDVFKGLGQDNIPDGLGVIEAQASSRLELSIVDGHDAGPEDLRHIGSGVDSKGQDRAEQLGGVRRDEKIK